MPWATTQQLQQAKYTLARAIYTCSDEHTEWQLRAQYAKLRDELIERGKTT